MQKEYVLGASIIVGCGLIATGLYAGLRANRDDGPSAALATGSVGTESAAPARSASLAASVDSTAEPSTSVPLGTSSARLSFAEAEAQAREAVNTEKKRVFIPKCWAPAIASNPEPKTSSYVLSLGFDAQGREVVRGVSEVRGKSRQDVAKCLRAQPLGFNVSPLSAPTTIEVTLDFP